MNPHHGKARLKAVGDEGIGNVLAIPRQKKVHAVNSRRSQMRGVTDRDRREDAAAHQFGGESLDLFVEVQ